METNSTISIYANPVLGLSVALEKQMEQIRQAQDFLAKQYAQTISLAFNSPLVELTKNIQKMHENMAKSLLFAMNPFAQTYPANTNVQEAEIVDERLEKLQMSVDFEGLFYFQSQQIQGISAGSKHGMFLKMLITCDDNYVSDQYFREKIDLTDELKGIGYVRRDLKKYLRSAGFDIEIRRVRKCGHRLISIKRLPN